MSKLTLLEATQDILSALNFDNVSSIDETVESVSVSQELKTTYYTMMGMRDWPHLCKLHYFDGLGLTSYPTKMRMPENVNKIKWVKYNNKEVLYMPPEEFQHMLDMRIDTTNANAEGYLTNKDPEYWTTFDDYYVWFDSYNSDEDNTLQQSRSKVFSVMVPTWNHVDTFVPDMPQKMFYTWLADAKSSCFILFKQTANAKEEKRARDGKVAMQNESWRNELGEARFNRKVNYGRK